MAELPSSATLEYNPQNHGVGTATNRHLHFRITEEGSHRRKAGNIQQPRIIHIIDTNGDEAPKTLRTAQEGNYSTFHVKDHGNGSLKEVQVNGNHVVVDNGVNRGKYGFSGVRLREDSPAVQIPLEGFIQLTLDTALELQRVQTPFEKQTLPEELAPALVNTFIDAAKALRDTEHPFTSAHALELTSAFEGLIVPDNLEHSSR
ncbi:MAG: hypothetical protein Q7T54_06245 [Candidatus Levybacteria bacterium]|nr:hypothetical protein [Candidatus Levybacteria bacterium]